MKQSTTHPSPQPRLARVLIATTVAALLAGSAVATAAVRPLPLRDRIIRSGDFRGFTPGNTRRFTNANQYVSGDASLTAAQKAAKVVRLHREGFKAILLEQLKSTKPNQGGLSWVMRLRSAAAAHTELAAATKAAERESGPRFPVGSIPSGRGVGAGNGRSGSENVLFADGPFVYLVGTAWNNTANPPTRAQLITAARRLYRRVHSHASS